MTGGSVHLPHGPRWPHWIIIESGGRYSSWVVRGDWGSSGMRWVDLCSSHAYQILPPPSQPGPLPLTLIELTPAKELVWVQRDPLMARWPMMKYKTFYLPFPGWLPPYHWCVHTATHLCTHLLHTGKIGLPTWCSKMCLIFKTNQFISVEANGGKS